MSSIWVIVCGLIRNPDCALHQARELARLRAEGLVQGVVLSTWHGELGRYPKVAAAFKSAGAIVVESVEPQLRLPGHVFHQSKSLLAALDLCPDDAVVFRMRPDIAPLGPELRFLFDLAWMDVPSERVNPAYRGRIWAHSGVWAWPLYVSDILFMGMKADLLQLVDIDLKSEALWSDLAPEQFFHLRRACQVDPVIAMFSRVQRGMRDSVLNQQLLEILWKSPLWLRTLKAYADRIADDYVIGLQNPSRVVSEDNLDGFRNISLPDLTSPDIRGPQFEYWPNLGVPIYHSTAWAEALRRGKFRQDAVLERILTLAPASHDELVDEANDLAGRLQKAFPDYLPRLPRKIKGRYVEESGPARYSIDVQKDELTALRAELTGLRRQLDDANYALRLAQGR
jgi:hypothetical protein